MRRNEVEACGGGAGQGGGGVLRPRRALVIHRSADVICDAFICAVAGNGAIAHSPHYGAAAVVVVVLLFKRRVGDAAGRRRVNKPRSVRRVNLSVSTLFNPGPEIIFRLPADKRP